MAKERRLKTAVIRVSSVNNTENEGVVRYTFDDIKNTLISWSQDRMMNYYAITHNADEDDEHTHFHIVLDFGRNSVPFSTIKNKFPYGFIESARSMRAAVQYLVHLNDLSKRAYSWDDVVTNDPNIGRYKVMSDSTLEMKTKMYIDQIMNGEIREYNFAEEIDSYVFAKKRTALYNALELYRMKVLSDKNRDIQVIVLEGDTGTGKTTIAKGLSLKEGKSVCVSSSENDPWQDYKGEDVLVLDELRDDIFSLSDLLKILDNHTKSTSRSRYSNKLFLGDTIFITTNQDWQNWYSNKNLTERNALKRRVTQYMKFTRASGKAFTSNVKVFTWSPDLQKYEYQGAGEIDYSEWLSDSQKSKSSIADKLGLVLTK